VPDGSSRPFALLALGRRSPRKPAGRPTGWDENALLVTFLEIEIELRLLRVRNPSAATITRLCKFLLDEGPFQPAPGGIQADTPDTLRRRYYTACEWQATLPSITRARHERMIARSVAARPSK
jgi:hypothetical protein